VFRSRFDWQFSPKMHCYCSRCSHFAEDYHPKLGVGSSGLLLPEFGMSTLGSNLHPIGSLTKNCGCLTLKGLKEKRCSDNGESFSRCADDKVSFLPYFLEYFQLLNCFEFHMVVQCLESKNENEIISNVAFTKFTCTLQQKYCSVYFLNK